MGKIKVLSADVAALIAAGEVVERPSSVIKELVENSIDAGAKSITVEIKNGGVSYMRVTDNGEGMSAEDVPNAFLRHATSKVSTAEDLEAISSLGFRGEALHSIAAVSNMSILTRREGEEGVHAEQSGGGELSISPAGCPVGTTVLVKDLFFNTPARMKFLKKDATEAGYIEDLLRKTALGSPEISFRYINGGKEVFFTPGDASLKNAVYAIYGKDIASAMIEAEYEDEGVKVYGLIGKSELSRPNRSFQTFFVNGRCVINKSFYFALSESYKNQIMTGRFPVAVLNIEMNPALCDVNVHPSKAEIKFANDKPVYDAIYWAVKNALYNLENSRGFDIPEKTVNREKAEPIKEEPVFKPLYTQPPKQMGFSYSDFKEEIKPVTFVADEPQKPVYSVQPVEIKREEPEETEDIQDFKVVGQVFDTYIIIQSGDEMMLIDQHAAHERLIYDKLLKEVTEHSADSQLLMLPVTRSVSGAEAALIEENKEFFEQMGFDADLFGDNTVRISAVPSTLSEVDAADALLEMVDALSNSRKDVRTRAQQYALYRVACKAAMKAGKHLSQRESEELVKEVLRIDGQPTCPHGRPVILRLTKTQIEKQFKRIV